MHVDFQDLLYHVVEDEDAEDDLTTHDEEVPVAHVADQLNCADLPGRDGPSRGWELYHQSVRKVSWLVGTGLPPHPQPRAPGRDQSQTPLMDQEAQKEMPWGKGAHLRIQKRLMLAL